MGAVGKRISEAGSAVDADFKKGDFNPAHFAPDFWSVLFEGPGTKPPKPLDAPGQAPTFDDQFVQAAAKAERQRLLGQQARKSIFLAGPGGDTSTPSLGVPSLLGK